MRAGTMDIRVTLQRPAKIETPSGQVAKTAWAEAGVYWAERSRDEARLITEAGEIFDDHTACYLLRWGVPVERGWRLVDPDGVEYNIDTVQSYRRAGMIKLTCSRVNP